MSESISVVRDVAAPADRVWTLVSDVTRMGEWSPETVSCNWVGGATAPEPGARFRGTNRANGRTWKTDAQVVDADPGRRFSFLVTVKGRLKVAEWGYDIEATPSGCRVTETWVDQRSGFFKPIAALATGVKDRAEHNRAGMELTLSRLAAAAESAAGPAS